MGNTSGGASENQYRFCICMIDDENNNNNENSKWIFCHCCKSWYHIICALLSENEHEKITKNNEKWYCSNFQCQDMKIENTQNETSQETHVELVSCSLCPPNERMKFYKGKKGLKIHCSRSHPSHQNKTKITLNAANHNKNDIDKTSIDVAHSLDPQKNLKPKDNETFIQSAMNKDDLIIFECIPCQRSFETSEGLQMHRNYHEKLGKKLNTKKFERQRKQHQNVVTSLNENDECVNNSINMQTECPEEIRCPFCEDSSTKYKNANGLKIHIGRKHPDEKLEYTSALKANSMQNFKERLCSLRQNIRTLKRIPKGARILAANKLSQLIEVCIRKNDVSSWQDLMCFSYYALQVPKKSSTSLSRLVKKNINQFKIDEPLPNTTYKTNSNLCKRIEAKVGEGDIRGAIRLLSSTDDIAPQDSTTLEKLRIKHPPPSRELHFPEPPDTNSEPLVVSEKEVQKGIYSFAAGSAAGIDGLRPQHLKDMISKITGDAGIRLLSSTTELCNFMLAGKVCTEIIEFFYGATLCALSKKDGGIRPIAVGNTFRRLTAKLGCMSVKDHIANLFNPIQMGFGVKGGCEAIVHAVRTFLNFNEESLSNILLKIDFKNAFNSIERDEMLIEIKEHAPKLYPFLWQCYSSATNLFFGNHTIPSLIGCQQGDPCGPLVFCLAIHSVIKSLNTDLNVWYLDDGTLGGHKNLVLENFKFIIDKCVHIGLEINPSKCEIHFCKDVNLETWREFNEISPGINIVQEDLNLLGAPLTLTACKNIMSNLAEKLDLSVSRLQKLKSHVAYFLLKNCLAIPKLSYFLRTSPSWKFPETIAKMDLCLKQSLESIINVNIIDSKWDLCSLPLINGGIGIRKIEHIGLPAFLSSVNSTSNLVNSILSFYDSDKIEVCYYNDAIHEWSSVHDNIPSIPSSQQNWDKINIERITSLFNFNCKEDSARFLASRCKESNGWLNVLPSKAIGTLLDNNIFRISVALRYGFDICVPHQCKCEKALVDSNGIHGLSCKFSAARFSRHVEFNDIVKRALASGQIPARLEPVGLDYSSNKRPDGMTLTPWSNGQILAWDATCSDTLAPSYIDITSKNPGKLAEKAAGRKRWFYREIIEQENLFFVPFAVETLGPICEEGHEFINKIAKKIEDITGDPRSKNFLIQRISIALQRNNAGCIMGTFPENKGLDEIFLL